MVSNLEEFFANIKRNATAGTVSPRMVTVSVEDGILTITVRGTVMGHVPADSDIPSEKFITVLDTIRIPLKGSMCEITGRLAPYGVTTSDVFYLVNSGKLTTDNWSVEL